MKHIVEKIELVSDEIRLIDPVLEDFIKIVESKDGRDLMFFLPEGRSYIIVDSKLMLGALKALTAKGERDRLNAKDRN